MVAAQELPLSCSKAEVIFAFFPFKDSFFLFLKSVVLRINDSCSKSVDRSEQERVEVTEDEPCPSRDPVGAWVHPPPVRRLLPTADCACKGTNAFVPQTHLWCGRPHLAAGETEAGCKTENAVAGSGGYFN